MAAGLGFKDFITGEVLTAADVDGYLMQGVWVFASAAARDAAVTSPQEGNFAYLKDTNVTTYYTGSAWANLDTTGMTNPMTTTGDTIYSSSGSTPARLGIGTTGQVLTVAGGVPSWATAASGGGMTLLSTTNLTGATTTVSSIDQTYVHLYLLIENAYGNNDAQALISYNGDTTTANYVGSAIRNYSGTTTNLNFENRAITGSGIDNVAQASQITATLFNYTNTTRHTLTYAYSITTDSASSFGGGFGVVSHNGTSAITSIGITIGGASTWSAGTVKIYGVK